MPFSPPDDAVSRERIYLYGDSGAGKTWAWLTIAHVADKTGSDAQFFVIDTDQAASLAIEPGADFEHLRDRIHVYDVFEWGEYVAAGKEVRANAGPNDWIIVDMLSNAWELLPSWWIANVFQEDQTDYWATMRRVALGEEDGDKGFGGMKGGVDWQYIKKVYLDFERPLTLGTKAHVLVTAKEAEVVDMYDAKGELRATFGQVGGFRPVGEKHTRHRFHSTMRIKRVRGDQEILLVRDRHKEHIWEEKASRGVSLPIKAGKMGFAMTYLKGVKGWRLA